MIAGILKEFKQSPDESINAMAKRIEFPQSTLNALFNGSTRQPSEKTINRLAGCLGSTPAYLRYRQGPKHPTVPNKVTRTNEQDLEEHAS